VQKKAPTRDELKPTPKSLTSELLLKKNPDLFAKMFSIWAFLKGIK
jgi:hypothetical protein